MIGFCPTCGYYCLGKGGLGCIDKPSMLNKKERKMNPDYKKIAIEATRDFIIELLQAGKYCDARRYGKALEVLIDGGLGLPTPAYRGTVGSQVDCCESKVPE